LTFLDRIEAAIARPPLSDVATSQLDELRELAADAAEIDDLPGKWQAAVLEAEQAFESRCSGDACEGHRFRAREEDDS
jgi:hypothetical protein